MMLAVDWWMDGLVDRSPNYSSLLCAKAFRGGVDPEKGETRR